MNYIVNRELFWTKPFTEFTQYEQNEKQGNLSLWCIAPIKLSGLTVLVLILEFILILLPAVVHLQPFYQQSVNRDVVLSQFPDISNLDLQFFQLKSS